MPEPAVARLRCLLQGCYYGLATTSDACVYCGVPRPRQPIGVSPITSAHAALVPSLSDDKATIDATQILEHVERAYLVGVSRDDLIAYIRISLQMAYTRGAGDGASHLAERLK